MQSLTSPISRLSAAMGRQRNAPDPTIGGVVISREGVGLSGDEPLRPLNSRRLGRGETTVTF